MCHFSVNDLRLYTSLTFNMNSCISSLHAYSYIQQSGRSGEKNITLFVHIMYTWNKADDKPQVPVSNCTITSNRHYQARVNDK